MKILFVLGDYAEHSIERQLAEVAEELIKKDARVIWYDPTRTLSSYRKIHGVWIFTHEEDGSCPEELIDFLENSWKRLEDTPITLSGIGGKDGAMNAINDLTEFLEAREARLLDDMEPVQIPLRSTRFDLDRDERWDLFWQMDAFLKYCGMDDSESRKIAFEKVVDNYFRLMKYLSADGQKPSKLSLDYPEIITDVGRFDCANLGDAPADLRELHFEIDALTEDYEIEEDELLPALLAKIEKDW